jgi:hypothetical protein
MFKARHLKTVMPVPHPTDMPHLVSHNTDLREATINRAIRHRDINRAIRHRAINRAIRHRAINKATLRRATINKTPMIEDTVRLMEFVLD